MNPWTTVLVCVVLTVLVMLLDAALAARPGNQSNTGKLEEGRAARQARLESEFTDNQQ